MKLKPLIPIFLVILLALAITTFVSADSTAGISLYPTQTSASTCIGSTVIYSFRLTNNTTANTAFTLSYTSIWPYVAPPTTPIISIGGFLDIQVSVYVPWTAQPGDVDTLSITAVGGGYSATATATTSANYIEDWTDLANTPRGARWSSVVYYDGRLYKIGGENGGAQIWLDIYDIVGNTWTEGATMPAPRYWIDCVAISGKIYCGGGFSGQSESTLYIYTISNNSWATGAELPYAVYNYASATLGGKYYIIGGVKTGSVFTNEMLVYNPIENSWDSTRAPMSTTRRMHSAGGIDGKIYVAGGYTGSIANPTYLASAEVFNPVTNSWTGIASMPIPLVNAADGVNYDRYLILAGGSSNSSTSSSTKALIYDTETNHWDWLPDMDRAIYGAEGDSDGTNFRFASGQIFVNNAWTASPYTTLMDSCAFTCPSPVTSASFTYEPEAPLTGQSVLFEASATSASPVINFSWIFDDGSTNTGSPVSHVFTAALTYDVELTASACDGASVFTTSQEVTVIDPAIIESSPTNLEAFLIRDATSQDVLELCNMGDVPLSWTMTESESLPLQTNADLLWVSESIVNGTIPADSCVSIAIYFNATGLEEGVYIGNLTISSNDPVNPVKNIPVSLTVTFPAISLVKTVGLLENTCGTDKELDVYTNTIVYYCFSITNTGGIPFDLHNLTDDKIGTLLDGYNYTLSPGTSMYVVSDGIPITENITNQATWYAEYGDYSASDTDTAIVTIIPNPNIWVYLPAIIKAPNP